MLLLNTMSYCKCTGWCILPFLCFSSSTAAVKKNVAWNKSELLTLWLLGRVNQFSKKVLIDFIQESNSLDRGLSGEKSDLLLYLSVSLYRAAWVSDTEKIQGKPKQNNWKQCQKKVLRSYVITPLKKIKASRCFYNDSRALAKYPVPLVLYEICRGLSCGFWIFTALFFQFTSLKASSSSTLMKQLWNLFGKIGRNLIILLCAGLELVFFTVVGLVSCFWFVMKRVQVTQWCFRY